MQTLTRPQRAGERLPVQGETSVVWVLWLTYGAFYFCRQNLAAAVPLMQEDLGYTKAQLGTVLGALKLTYGIGQLVNGQLAERVPARWLLAIGMFGSAALNVLFGSGTALYFLFFVWACNGYFQSLGWTPTMRVVANWVPVDRRGRAVGIIGTGYQLMGAVAVVVAGKAAALFGWRGALYAPAALLAAAGLFMLLFLREAPKDTGRESDAAPVPTRERLSPADTLRVTLTNPALWLLAIALCLLDACRYGFTDWGLTHLKEVQGAGVDAAALKISVLPLGGILGAYTAGWVSDRYFGGRRGPVMCVLLLCLGVLALAYDWVARHTLLGTLALLVLIGFAIFGPQVLLVGTAPADLARRGTAAAAAGFVNFMGYMGAFAGDRVTGTLVDKHGWQTAIWVWAGCAFGAALVAALLWNTTASRKPPLEPHDRRRSVRTLLSTPP